MDFTYLRSRRVYAALEGHPDRPSLSTVERWCAGTSRPPRWADDYLTNLVVGIRHEEAAPPEWAERLADVTARKVIEALAPADIQAAAAELIARLEGTQPPNGEVPRVAAGESDQAGLGQPRRARE